MNDAIKRKIQKLLALSKSPNENEALQALEKAQALMEQYNLKEDDITIVEAKVASRKKTKWESLIAQAVSWLNGTAFIHVNFTDDNFRRKSEYRFYGNETDVFITNEMYSYLVKTIDRIAKKNIRKNAKKPFIESYKFGVALNLWNRIKNNGKLYSWANKRDEKIKKAQTYVDKLYEDWNENISVKNKQLPKNKEALSKGFSAGNEIALNHQATGKAQKAITSGGIN